MAELMIRGLPDDLHQWLRQQAQAHHRSLNKEVVSLLENLRRGRPDAGPRPSTEEILAQGARFAALPVIDARGADDILGYDNHGLPR